MYRAIFASSIPESIKMLAYTCLSWCAVYVKPVAACASMSLLRHVR